MNRLAFYFSGLLLVLATLGWTRLKVDTGIEATLGDDMPAVSRLRAIQRDFRLGDQVRIMVDAGDSGAAVSPEAIQDTRSALLDSADLLALGVRPDALPETLVRHWLMTQIPHARGWLDEAGLTSLRQRLEPQAMTQRMERHRARLATPQPAEVTRQMLRDPLDLRELIPRELAPHDLVPRDRVPRDRVPRDRGPQDREPRDRGQRDRGPQDWGPRDLQKNTRIEGAQIAGGAEGAGGAGGARGSKEAGGAGADAIAIADADAIADAALPTINDDVSAPPGSLVGRINAQGNAWQCRLSVPFATSDAAGAERLRNAITQALAPLETAYPHLDFYAAGPHLVAAEAAARVRSDMRLSIVFATSGLILVFLFAWRRGTPIVILMVSTGAALYTAFGLYGLSGWRLSPLAALSGGMLAGLGIDHGIHVLTEAGQADPGNMTATRRARLAARRLVRPIATACATTLCGFMALAATEPAALKQLALLGGLGIACAGLSAVSFLPALASLGHGMLPRQRPHVPRPLIWALARPTLLRGVGVGVGIGLIGLLLIPLAGRRKSGLYDLHPQPNPVLQAQEVIHTRFGEPAGSVPVHLDADSPADLLDKLRALETLDVPFVLLSPARLVPPAGQDARNAERLGDLDPAGVGQGLLDAAARAGFGREAFVDAADFIERFLKTPSSDLAALAAAPAGRLFLPRRFDPHAPQAVVVLIPERAWSGQAARREDLARLESELVKVPGAEATGLDVLGERLRHDVRRELAHAFLWAAVPLMVILALSLRSAKRVLVTLIPPAMAMLAAAVVLRLGSGHWNMVTLAAVPLLLGIGVDASLFLDDATRSRSPVIIAGRLRAIHLTCLTSFVGFGSLCFASIPAVRELGWLMIAGLAAILAATYLFVLAEARGD